MSQSWKTTLIECTLAFVWFAILSTALTWPMVMHPTEVIVGGGELGGWFWRQWWHYSEVKALEQEDFGYVGYDRVLDWIEGVSLKRGNILDILFLTFPLREWLGVGLDHNAKIMIILMGNGMCGYVLARCFTNSWIVSLWQQIYCHCQSTGHSRYQ